MFKNGLYNILGAGIRLVLTIGTLPLLIATIGLNEYGVWTLVTTVINIVILAEAGLSVATTVFLAQDIAQANDAGIQQTLTVTFSALCGLATGVAILVWAGAATAVTAFARLPAQQSSVIAQALQLSAVVIWALMLQQWCGGIIQAHQRYDLLNGLTTLQTLLQTLGLLVIALLGGRTLAFLEWFIGVALTMLIAYGGTAGWLLRHRRLRLSWSRQHSRTILRYSGLSWAASLGGVLFTRGDRLIVGALLGTAPLGIYAAITNITGQIHTISGLPVQPLLPVVSGYQESGTQERAALIYTIKRALQVNTIVALGLGAGGLLFAPTIIGLILPQASAESILGFRVASSIYALFSINAVGFYILFALKRVKACTIIQLTSGGLACLLIWVLCTRFGLLGALAGNMGYLGIWGLTFTGLRAMRIPFSSWSRWIVIPLAWFITTLGISVFVPPVLVIQTGVFSVQLGFLAWWMGKEFMDKSMEQKDVVCEL